MKLAMIGAGYVGLVTGAGFSQFGHEVVCADLDINKVDKLNRGESPIYEPGLDDLLMTNIKEGRLSFSTDVRAAIEGADVIFITVGTPQADDGSADLSAVMATARTIGEVLKKIGKPSKVVVLKSTVPVGTTRTVGQIIASYCDGYTCVASNPEFLREGTAVEDFMRPDRVVIGTNCQNARETLVRLYKPFTNPHKIFVMDPSSSELTKYASNAILATRISFMNELANLASSLGANIDRIREGMGADARIGPQYLYPGPGYGGSCFPKDVSALMSMAHNAGQELLVVKAADQANKIQLQRLGLMVYKHFKQLEGKRICVWGAAFKAETDDIRESPALAFINKMIESGVEIVVHDPQALDSIRRQYGSKVKTCDNMYEAARGADALVLCTEWRQYRSPDLDELLRMSSKIAVFDGRNVWDKSDFDAKGITYISISRRRNLPKSEVSLEPLEDDLQPISMLSASDDVVSSRRPLPLENHSMNESGPGMRVLAK